MRKIKFNVTDQVLDLGVKILTAQISGLKNSKSNPDFENYLKSELEAIKKQWNNKQFKDDPVLQGFRELHTKVGRSNRDYPASPEVLLRLFLERGRFPRINSVVDIYNLVSLKTRLALGAHDINNVKGDITLRLTNGDEKFLPLGKTELVSVPAGEYSYIDDGNNIICRLEVLQVEPTKITTDSENIFLIVQGNPNTDIDYVRNGANEVLNLLTQFCGGEFSFLNDLI